MKKLVLLFAGLSLLAFTGCEDDETERTFGIVGYWQPLKEVRTTVPLGGTGVSDEILYSDCQKESRWAFPDKYTGKRTEKGDSATPGQCATVYERNFTYNYSEDTKEIEIKYQGIVEPARGKVTSLTENTMNITFEDKTDPTEYQSTTFTFKRNNN
ncbi:lipocalin family protein [Chryseobacterium fluminis]|uniref:lipocalin family protein n=1 Tax=Chryseobacterium fluminis TaxID=2983606 RepID=UPI0022594313|nr:lipocalin family protein [Chryseobacterium sp. MMS21-Ot14]UZT95940.1 lipocalin family protein [Chryseobacterium sp. MMS21-Ot14]